jgi:hypothetical protein
VSLSTEACGVSSIEQEERSKQTDTKEYIIRFMSLIVL